MTETDLQFLPEQDNRPRFTLALKVAVYIPGKGTFEKAVSSRYLHTAKEAFEDIRTKLGEIEETVNKILSVIKPERND